MLVREIVLPFVALCLLHLTLSDGKSLGDSQTPAAFALVPEDEPVEKTREARQYGFSGGFGGFDGYGGGEQSVYGKGYQDHQNYGHGGNGYGGDYGHGGGYGQGGGYGHGGGNYGHEGGNYGHGGGHYGHGGGSYGHGGGGYGHGGGSYGHGGGGYGHGSGGYGHGGYGGGYGGSEGGYGGDHHHHQGYGRGFLPEFGVQAAPFFAPGAVLQYNQPQPFPGAGGIRDDGGIPPVLLLPQVQNQVQPQVYPQPLPLPLPHPASPVYPESPNVVKPVQKEELAILNKEEVSVNRKADEPEKNLTVKDEEKEECICKKKSQAKEDPKV